MAEQKLPPSHRRSYVLRPFWWLGMAGVLLAAIGDFLALALASQALVAALGGATTLLTNVLVARLWNKDRLVWTDAVGVMFVIGGATYFACTQESMGVDDMNTIKRNFTKKWFMVYLVGQGIVIFILLATVANSFAYRLRVSWTNSLFSPLVDKMLVQEARLLQLESQNRQMILALQEVSQLDDSLSFEIDPVSTPRSSTLSHAPTRASHKLQWYDKYTYAACSGAIGGLSVLFGSCTGKSLSCSTCSFGQAFSHEYFYAFLISMLVCVVAQTHLLNKAMELGGTMSVFPVFEAFWISFGVIGGLVFYNDSSIQWGDDIKQGAGAFFMLVGVVFLLRHPESQVDRDFSASRESENLMISSTLFEDQTPRMSPLSAGSYTPVVDSVAEDHHDQPLMSHTCPTFSSTN
eukprot:TRINITY_DN2704_c0_g1_i3.p1 TRINITY_DN2704_c0_g1~~TRINITY_DN2704_c0_g1_i3.p1  ORF type:complete len:406 (+),score=85.93 TRINITY_DN2704_c0_g1_i3:220-1437(+)